MAEVLQVMRTERTAILGEAAALSAICGALVAMLHLLPGG